MKSSIVTLLLVAGLWAGEGFGQVEVEWQYRYNRALHGQYNNATIDVCTDFIKTLDGGYVLAGYSEMADIRHNDFWIVKTDSTGRRLWSRNYGGSGNDLCQRVFELGNGNLLLCGKTTSFGGGILVVRTNFRGDSIWSQRITGRYVDIPYDFYLSEDEYLTIAAQTAWYIGDDYEGNPIWVDRPILRTIDLEGNSIDSQLYLTNGSFSDQSIHHLSNGGFLLTGNISGESEDGGLFRLNENLDSMWFKTFDREYEDFFTDVIEKENGGFAVVGWGRTGGVSAKVWLIRTDANGDTLWTRVFGNPDQTHTCFAMTETNDNGFALVGYRFDGRFGPNSDGLLIKIDSTGNPLWTFLYGDGGTRFNKIIQNLDGSFMLIGKADSDFLLLKTTPDPTSVREPAVSLVPSGLNLVSAYPNPFNSTLNIGFSGPINREATLSVFDGLGREVCLPQVIAPNSKRVVWSAEGLPAGNYFVNLNTSHETISHKVILVK